MQSLFPNYKKMKLVHKEVKGRKGKRNLIKGRPHHLILKSRYILLTHRKWIEEKIKEFADKFGVRVHEYAVCGDHIHFAIEFSDRIYYVRFIRALTGTVAKKMGKGIWCLIPFTKIYKWGKPFRYLKEYIVKNRQERAIERKYEPRKYPKNKRVMPYLPPATFAPCVTNAL